MVKSGIVYITITLFTLEGISRKGHMISTTKRLEQSETLRNQRSKGVLSLLISL